VSAGLGVRVGRPLMITTEPRQPFVQRGNSDRWMSDVQARRPSVRSLPVVASAIALTP